MCATITQSWYYYPAETRESFRAWLRSALAQSEAGNEAAFATLDAESGEPIGSTRYLALRPAHRGLENAFERLHCMRVEFKTDARNERSRAALATLPARFEGIFRKHMVVRGDQHRDSAYYSIVDDEWPEVKENLRRRLAR